MAVKLGSDLEELRALLAEVKALREGVDHKAAELRSAWGVDADKSKVTPRVLNLSHYIALREHDLTDLQYRLAARGLSSLGRSESHVLLALDTLIATLKRLTGERARPIRRRRWRGRAPRSWRRKPTGCSANGKKAARAPG